MFSLFCGIYREVTKKRQINLLLLGVDGSGKTTLLEGIKGKYTNRNAIAMEHITPTIGMNVVNFSHSGCKVKIWDLGGKPSIRGIWSEYYKDCHGVVFLVKYEDRERVDEIRELLLRLIKHADLKNCPIVICWNSFGNDFDDTIVEKIDVAEIKRRTKEMVTMYHINSATGDGVDEMLKFLLQYIKKYGRYIDVEEFV